MQPDNAARNTTEIDLIELLGNLLAALWSKRFWALAGVVLGAGAGTAYYYSKDKEYRSSMVAICHSFTDSRVIEHVQDLDQLIQDNDRARLAQMLGLSMEEVKPIQELEVVSAYELEKTTKKLNDDKMDLKESAIFQLKAAVSDTAAFAAVQRGVVHYFSSISFSQKQLKTDSLALTIELQAIQDRIKRIDDESVLMRSAKSGSTIITGLRNNQVEVVELVRRIAEIEKELSRMEEVRVVKPFTIFKKARWPKLSIMLGAGAAIGAIMMLIMGFIVGRKAS